MNLKKNPEPNQGFSQIEPNPTNSIAMTAKIRLTATQQEIDNWKTFFDLLARANVINLLEVSDSYSNRGNSQYRRVYLEAELLGDVSGVVDVTLTHGREDV